LGGWVGPVSWGITTAVGEADGDGDGVGATVTCSTTTGGRVVGTTER
jgi:hypothetical protein